MSLSDYIGFSLDYVVKELDKQKIKYIVAESSDIQKKYDTILVVKIEQQGDVDKIITDKFLLNI